MELFAGSTDDTSRARIQEREGRGLRKEHPRGGPSGDRRRTIAPTGRPSGACDNPAMDPHRRALRRAAVLVALAAIVAACGSSSATVSPSPSEASVAPSVPATPTPDPATVYAGIEAQVQQLRGLSAKTTVEPTLLDEAGLKRNMTVAFDKSNPAAIVDASQRLYELLGLIPAGSSLHDLFVKLLGSQVAGYYDPDTKQLYVVSRSGAIGALEKTIFAHEYDHALQDQNFGLENLDLESVGHGDATLAHQAVAEGDATLLMTIWAQSNLTTAELIQLAQAASDPEAAKTLAEMPDILKETLTFPYTAGMELVVAAQASSGGWKGVDALYQKPPASTEQVLHPEKYTAGEAPIGVSFPKDLAKRLGAGWTVAMEDTFGEFQLGVWLKSAGKVPAATATTAAAGWGGDRVALVTNGDRAGVVLDTRWDTPADAAEFAAAAQTALDAIGGHHAMIAIDGTDRVTLFVATDDATISALGSVLGLAG